MRAILLFSCYTCSLLDSLSRHKEAPGYHICLCWGFRRWCWTPGPERPGLKLCSKGEAELNGGPVPALPSIKKIKSQFFCCSDFIYHFFGEESSDLYLQHNISHKLYNLVSPPEYPSGNSNQKCLKSHYLPSNFKSTLGPTIYLVIQGRNLFPISPTLIP